MTTCIDRYLSITEWQLETIKTLWNNPKYTMIAICREVSKGSGIIRPAQLKKVALKYKLGPRKIENIGPLIKPNKFGFKS